MKIQNQTKKITDEEIRKLVIERLKTFPTGKGLSIGQEGTFTKEEFDTVHLQGVFLLTPR